MFLVLIFCLNMAILGKSSELMVHCENVTVTSIYNMCRNPDCVLNDLVNYFCQNVYEGMFKCPLKNIPLSLICDGINHCENGIDEDPVICNNRICEENSYKCTNNKCIEISNLCDGFQDCEDGLDESPIVCRKFLSDNISCPAIFNDNHAVSCFITYGNTPILLSCHETLPAMTVAEVRCKSFYISTSNSGYQRMICQNNGRWDQKPMKCKANCGVADSVKFSPLILNGWSIKPSSWPWYAALFGLNNEKWVYFCSATLISRNMVVTAAHCVWNMSKERIKVVAGKFFTDFYSVETNSQTGDIQELILHPLYQDSMGNYASDIAIIILSKPFSLSHFVLPICLNFTLRNYLKDIGCNLEGTVVGMGITENISISFNLRAATVSIISNEDCINNQTYEFRKYVSVSSFCAGRINGTGVCNGDSGSGLARKNKAANKWILEGIVSISPRKPNDFICDSQYYSIFTNVGMYSNWIYKYFSQYSID